MASRAIADGVTGSLDGSRRLVVASFVSPDTLAHAGPLPACVRALEAVDDAVGRIADAALARGAALVVTADHGNVEALEDGVRGRHTASPVHVTVAAPGLAGTRLRPGGSLADVAPTVLGLMGLPVPAAMTGRTLVLAS
jgi:2,3-bisphosphoglycerate-independent phosphoglycerate mutase